MAITLEWLISHEQLNNFRCVAGREQLGNVVKSVNILDNPDVVKWIKRDEFVLTTGFVFKDDPALQCSIIRDLKETGCAGVGFKIKRFFQSVPEEMIAEADRVGLPLIEMPFYYAFSDIMYLIYDLINEQKLDDIEMQNKWLDSLSASFFENAGLDHMLGQTALFLKKPVFLIDLENTLISAAVPPKYAHLFPENGLPLFRAPAVSPISRVSKDKTSSDIYKYLSVDGQDYRFLVSALPNSMGSLCVLTEDEVLDSFSRTAAGRAAHLIALELAKTRNTGMPPHTYHDFFLDFLLSPAEKTDEETVELCSFYGFDYRPRRVCVTFLFSDCESEYYQKQVMNTLSRNIEELVSDGRAAYLCAGKDLLSVFFFYGGGESSLSAAADAERMAAELYRSVKNSLPGKLSSGVGRCHGRISSIRTAFQESIAAIDLHPSSGGDPVYSYTGGLSYHLLKKLPPKELEELFRDTVEPLVRYDAATASELYATFKAYFACCFNASETAKKMFLHRNTLMNRLEKIKELLGTDFSDYGKMDAFYLGICAYELLQNSP